MKNTRVTVTGKLTTPIDNADGEVCDSTTGNYEGIE